MVHVQHYVIKFVTLVSSTNKTDLHDIAEIFLKVALNATNLNLIYTFHSFQVDLEKKNPKSQERQPIGKLPQLWGESLYILAKLITEVT